MNTSIEIGKRIRKRREEKQMTQDQLAKALWLNKSTIQRYESGKIETIKMPIIQSIAKQLDVSTNWLTLKTDIPDSFNQSDVDAALRNTEEHDASVFRIKFSPLKASVPLSESFDTDHFFADDPKQNNSCENIINTSIDIDANFAIKVLDDNMSVSGIKKGDIAFVKKQSFLENGKIAVVNNDNKFLLKRFYYYEDSKKLILQTDNPEIEPQIFTDEEIDAVQIQGQVVGFATILK